MRTEWIKEIERLTSQLQTLNRDTIEKEEKMRRTGMRFIQNSIDANVKKMNEIHDRIRLIQDQPEIRAHNKVVRALNNMIRNRNRRLMNGMMAALLSPGSITEKTKELSKFMDENAELVL